MVDTHQQVVLQCFVDNLLTICQLNVDKNRTLGPTSRNTVSTPSQHLSLCLNTWCLNTGLTCLNTCHLRQICVLTQPLLSGAPRRPKRSKPGGHGDALCITCDQCLGPLHVGPTEDKRGYDQKPPCTNTVRKFRVEFWAPTFTVLLSTSGVAAT